MSESIRFRRSDDLTDYIVNDEHPLPVEIMQANLDPPFEGIDYEQLSSSASVQQLTTTKLGRPTRAVIVVETNAIRYLYYENSKATLSTSVGTPANPGDVITVDGKRNLANFCFIQQSAAGKLNINYEFRPPQTGQTSLTMPMLAGANG